MKQAYILGLALMTSVASASANTTYSYQGTNYDRDFGFGALDSPGIPGSYDFNMSLSLSFVLIEPLTPNVSFTNVAASVITVSFFDGRFLRTGLGPNDSLVLNMSTDAFGMPKDWTVTAHYWDGPPLADGSIEHAYSTSVSLGAGGVVTGGDFVRVSLCGDQCGVGILAANEQVGTLGPGVWTVTPNPVPLPAAAWLLGSAIGGLGLMRRRRTA